MTSDSDASRSVVADEFLAAYAAGDWPRAVAAIEQHWTTLVFSRDTLEQVLATLHRAPEAELLRSPRVALISETFGRLPAGSTTVRVPGNAARIDQAMREGTARELVELSIHGMIARRATGRPDEAAAIARAARPLMRATSVTRFSAAADLAAYWHLQAGQATLHLGDLEQARLDFQHAWTFCDNDITGYVAPSTAPFLALLATLAGDDDDANRWQAEVDRLEPRGRSLIEWETMERPRHVARLIAATDRLDIATGERLTELLRPQLAFDETWPITVFAIVRHLGSAGAATDAEQLIQATAELRSSAPSTGSMHGAFVTLARADAALAQGRGTTLGGVLAGADPALLPGLTALYGIHLHVLAGDLPAARSRATVTEHQATQHRVQRESRLLGTAIDLALGDAATTGGSPFDPALRRVASLLPPDVNEPLRAAYGDGVPPPTVGLAGSSGPVVKLTPGEVRVLAALAEPGSLPQVAERLYISRNTLKTHVRALYTKLGVSSRDEAVSLGRALGLLDGG